MYSGGRTQPRTTAEGTAVGRPELRPPRPRADLRKRRRVVPIASADRRARFADPSMTPACEPFVQSDTNRVVPFPGRDSLLTPAAKEHCTDQRQSVCTDPAKQPRTDPAQPPCTDPAKP